MNKLVPIAGGSALVYVCLALAMGVLPGIELSNVPPGPGVEPLTELESAGRDIYAANGCGYCHTQQVRPLAQDSGLLRDDVLDAAASRRERPESSQVLGTAS